MNTEWIPRTQNELSRMAATTPNSTEDIVYLAALYALSDRFNAEPMQDTSTNKTADMGDFERYMGYAEEERADAEKYHDAGEDETSVEELAHMQRFIDKAKRVAYSQEQRNQLRMMQSTHDLMEQAIH